MSYERTKQEIEDRARQLHYIYMGGDDEDRDSKEIDRAWYQLSEDGRKRWEVLARSIPGVVHFESATSGGYPTAPQADRIRELRTKYLRRNGREQSWIVAETRPYGDMVLIFEYPGSVGLHRDTNWRKMGWIIHPDGHCVELHISLI